MLEFKANNGIGILTLNRPEKRNALNPELISDLIDKLHELENDDAVQVLILTGAGKSFCAGVDLSFLKNLQKFSLTENEKDSENLGRMFLSFYNFPKPTIAAVTGAAIAGGCGLASVCDFVVASPSDSKFGYSEVKIGFIPAIVSIFLIHKIGIGRTKKLLLTGEMIDGEKAFNYGLVDYLRDNPLEEAMTLAALLQRNSKISLNLTKKMIHSISNLNVEDAVNYCVKLNTLSRTSEDFLTGINNFLNNPRK